jgi:hypothetical protein
MMAWHASISFMYRREPLQKPVHGGLQSLEVDVGHGRSTSTVLELFPIVLGRVICNEGWSKFGACIHDNDGET